MFRYGASEQVFRVRVHRVVAGDAFTSLEWAIVSVTGGDGVEAASAPPFASADAATVTAHNPVAASGPVLRVDGDGTVLRTRVMTNRSASGEADECLCTDLRGWAAVLRRPDKVATVVTNYPALPEGTQQVEVVFAGLDPITVDGHAGVRRHRQHRGPRPDEPHVLAVATRRPAAGLEDRRVADAGPHPSPARAVHRHGGPSGALRCCGRGRDGEPA